MTSQTLSLLCTFDSHDFTEWKTTARHVINTTGCQMALGTKPSPILINNAEMDDSSRARDNWDNQNS